MIEINLLPEELRKPVSAKNAALKISPKQLTVGFLAVFFGAQILLTIFSVAKQIEAGHLRSAAAKIKSEHPDLIELKRQNEAAKKTIKQVNTLTARKFEWHALLNALSDSVTKGVWLRTLSLEYADPAAAAGGRKKAPAATDKPSDDKIRVMRIDGSVVARGEETAYIGRFIKELKQNALLARLFDAIELSNISQKKIKDTDVYDFTITCAFKREMGDFSS